MGLRRSAFLIGSTGMLAAPVMAQTGAARVPDGVYTYRWTKNEAIAGESLVTVRTRGDVVGMNIKSNLSKIAISTAKLTFGSKLLELRSYQGFVSQSGVDMTIGLALANGTIAGTATTTYQSIPISVPLFGPTPVVAVDDGLFGSYLFLPSQLARRGTLSFQVITTATGTSGLISLATSTAGPYPPGIPTTDTVGTLASDTVLWYDDSYVVDQFTRAELSARLVFTE